MGGSTIRSTTILSVRHKGRVAIGGDGQVTSESQAIVIKRQARKIRRIYDEKVAVGFAGAVVDAFALLEVFEAKLKEFRGDLQRAAVQLVKEWRTGRSLRHFKAEMIVVDKQHSLYVSGTGEVMAPDDGVVGIGSGAVIATAAARALVRHSTLEAPAIVEEALRIAAEMCIYTNDQIHVEEVC